MTGRRTGAWLLTGAAGLLVWIALLSVLLSIAMEPYRPELGFSGLVLGVLAPAVCLSGAAALCHTSPERRRWLPFVGLPVGFALGFAAALLMMLLDA